RHQEIYRVVLDLAADSKPIDPLTIVNELERKGVLEKVGGAAYVTGLEQYVISPGNVLHHAKIVHEKSLLRRLIRTSAEIAEDAYTESDDAKSLLQASEQKIFNILSGRSSAGEFRSIDEEASQVFLDVVHRAEKRDEVSGLPTGLSDLDKMTGGMHPSDLMILAARPSVGKTSLALNMAVSACRHKREFGDEFKHPAAAVFSLEMSRDQLIQRLVCTEAEIPMDLLRKNMMSEKQLRKFQDGLTALRELPIYINDTAGLDPTELRLQAQRLKSRVPELSLIVIDYLQLMSIRHSNVENRQQEVSQISRMLKALARDLNVPVLALSQLSRGVESRTAKDAKPRLSDLRESGAIEQDADVVMFLHRVFRPEREAGEERGNQPSVSQVDLIIAKQRNGPIGTCHLLFLEDYTHFVRMAPEDVPPGGH
ncbi:TPA: replicative DNA helicase, partial [Candidatus Sumerlaeota bacterium]|nr:replicative DNA helicase [Candidatus Sumerlaeota bacterium]